MNKKCLILGCLAILLFQTIVSGQKLEQDKVEQLTEILNITLADNFKVELNENNAFCQIDDLNKTLDLRDSYHIAEDTITKEGKAKLYKGRYGGPVFWKHNFQSATSSKVLFKATKTQKLFCKISFDAQATIILNSQLNAYTSHHKISDATLHDVHWKGEKYISLTLVPIHVDDTITFQLRGITISGKFERADKKVISKDYVKSLRNNFKREFKTLFESEEITSLITQKLNNKLSKHKK